MVYRLSPVEVDAAIALARELTGANVNAVDHGIILQNIGNRILISRCSSFRAYLEYTEGNDQELDHLVSAVTIHTTSWFREPLGLEALAKFAEERAQDFSRHLPFRALSVGCSSGEEAFSIGTVLEAIRLKVRDFEYTVEGWDIDPVSLRVARGGRYNSSALSLIPTALQGIAQDTALKVESEFSVNSEIVRRCRFRTVNALKPPSEGLNFDFVFCRNMLIYFDNESVLQIIRGLRELMAPGSRICCGISEVGVFAAQDWKPVGYGTFIAAKERVIAVRQPELSPLDDGSYEVLVVDDEEEIRGIFSEALQEAEAALKKRRISLVFSDHAMGRGSTGLELCRRVKSLGIAARFVLVSGYADSDLSKAALLASCDEVVAKPVSPEELIRLAEVYCRRGPSLAIEPDAILIGASTGGTEVLVKMLANMPGDCPPIAVVQHITPEFAGEFAARLRDVSGLKLVEAGTFEPLQAGQLCIATGDFHIGLKERAGVLSITADLSPEVNGHRPSVDFLFESAAATSRRFVAALLTGMGRDGANGLLKLKERGSETLVQNEATSAVFGMPREAIRIGAAQHVCSPSEIRSAILRVSRRAA